MKLAYEDFKVLPTCRTELLEWWDRGHRPLPWRQRKDAYEVWVSEVMLQQTQVERVIPYWQEWTRRWPTFHDLAQADIEDVRSAWSGLGYYRRAAFMLDAAKRVDDGRVPQTRDEWLALPGVGPYTAAAVASICYDEQVPVVDGNVVRVLARLQACPEPKDSKLWWKLAGDLVGERQGDLNQAIMELGATVCTPRNPKCAECPLRDRCRGKDSWADFPAAKAAAAIQRITLLVCVAQHGDKVALQKRSDDAQLLSGLWQLPQRTLASEEALDAALDDILENDLGAPTVRSRSFIDKPLAHSITNRRFRIHVASVVVDPTEEEEKDDVDSEDISWLSETEVAAKGTSSIVTKALDSTLRKKKKKTRKRKG